MRKFPGRIIALCCSYLLFVNQVAVAQTNARVTIDLNRGWHTVSADTIQPSYNNFYAKNFNDAGWKAVSVPHNWDQYEGYRRLRHGNKHGYAWYRKTFEIKQPDNTKRYFLFFEGVGSYATVWLNGKMVGKHAGGRTSFTVDATKAINKNGSNTLAVRAGHPAMINDLPWLCGGCSDDRGWSEGSQPLGIFRPVHLVITDAVRIEPFGVHIWNKEKKLTDTVTLNVETEIKNYSAVQRSVVIKNKLIDATGQTVLTATKTINIKPGDVINADQQFQPLVNPKLWSPGNPYLYSVVTDLTENGKLLDRLRTSYGIRWIEWPTTTSANKQFLLNGKPVFINGTCEYEHQMGRSHAFNDEEIRARVMQIKAAGFNAFRDAHQPHNLLYSKYWNELGILNWPQFSAHAWYDNAAFKENFKALLGEWIRERRNDPSVIMWGLQNESKIPEDFAKECTEYIRQLDPTASTQRPVTTCNGGEGSDWNVPQNWTGTYGGDPDTYGEDLKRQLLVGEYGAWRSLDLHTEGSFQQNGIMSEDRMVQLMEKKVRLAESVKDSVAGHFHWLFSSHENPGRVQGGEGFRELDRVGPVNYKGIFTPWGEPLDVFYMYRSNYTDKQNEPMVYIVSHTWPHRWLSPGIKDSIIVYSNCDEVELFNDIKSKSLGIKNRNGIGTHFQWDKADINYNVLYAEGKVNGKVVAMDYIVLNHLPIAPNFGHLKVAADTIIKPQNGYNYLYRVNCGGPDYRDSNGNLWLADGKKKEAGTWGSTSWTDTFKLPAFFASQRHSNDPVKGTNAWPLFQSFRYGMDQLKYEFPVADGEYLIELYFTEPWYGTGGGMDCTGWRLFDVAVNGNTVLHNIDIWKAVGHDAAFKKIVKVKISGGKIVISFPNVAAGEAIICGIAIASPDKKQKPAPKPQKLISEFVSDNKAGYSLNSWLNTGDTVYKNAAITFSSLPAALYGAEWLQASLSERRSISNTSFKLSEDADVFIATTAFDTATHWLKAYTNTNQFIETDENGGTKYQLYSKRFNKGSAVSLESIENAENAFIPYIVIVSPVSTIEPAYDLKTVLRFEAENAVLNGASIADTLFAGKKFVQITRDSGSVQWTISPGVADQYSLHFRYKNQTGKPISMKLQLLAADGSVMKETILDFPPTAAKWATVDSDTGSYINAGNYKIILTAMGDADIGLDFLEVQ